MKGDKNKNWLRHVLLEVKKRGLHLEDMLAADEYQLLLIKVAILDKDYTEALSVLENKLVREQLVNKTRQ